MNRIWAPWRMAYIRPKRRQKGCLFCRLRRTLSDQTRFIVKRTPWSYAVLNRFPYNNGHVLIVPNRHVDTLRRLSDEERLDWLSLHDEMITALKKTLKPHGFNVGVNLGRIAGAGIPHHLHAHIVPRWEGDANFMPVVGETKVISESLKSVYLALRKVLGTSRSRRRKK